MLRRIQITESLTTCEPSYDRIAKVYKEIANCNEHAIELIVNVEKRLGLSFLFYISTFPYLAKSRGKNIVIMCNAKSIDLFRKFGSLSFKDEIKPYETDIAPLLMSKAKIINDPQDIFDLVTEITKNAPVKMDDHLAEIFISRVGEIYNNSLEHSEADYVIGAKYFRNQKSIYCFSCYDTGVGIPQKVINTIAKRLSQKEAFLWALKRGNSTANQAMALPIPRGLGLDLLHSFAKANKGTIRICSGNIFYLYNTKNGSRIVELKHSFPGTLYEMDIITDNERKYIIK
ncbi:MAG: ATP-binding protein [Lachnoclostridium sp.]|nr:ATP-binding protein [Lachnoclostridium sp.]